MNLKYITRLHYRSYGWRVRPRFAEIQKSFSDSAYGSKSKSLKAAIKFRDACFRDLAEKGLPTGRKPKGHHKSPTIKSRTGVVGVHYVIKTNKDGSRNKSYVGTYYPQKYQHRVKSFSVNKYGEKKAFKLAAAFRREGLRSLSKGREQPRRNQCRSS
jgi:hypothetical protein